ncbi:MAG: hypothetical protein E3K40_10095 [Candidatus Brocadia sp.]|nr:hypothetical protein [Candidatus Brocadia sp.]MDG6027035.1 hypothetical protein [Candidatus Brocadia sp.]
MCQIPEALKIVIGLAGQEYFREHVIHVSWGTVAGVVQLHTAILTDVNNPHALEIWLESIEVVA